MEWIQQIIDNSNTPILIAFLLGILTAISPCPLATNITAIGFISKDVGDKKRVLLNGLLYTLGRTIAYMVLAIILILIIKKGASTFNIQKQLGKYGHLVLPPLLLLLAFLILFADKIRLPSLGFKGGGDQLKNKGWWGAILLGALFAMAFCPSSGVFYFGMLIPLSVSTAGGYFLLVVYAIATGLPVIVVAWIIAFSANRIGNFYGKLVTIQNWCTRIAGILCLLAFLYYLYTFYF